MPLDKKNKSIAVLCPYPMNIAPGQRFRVEMPFEFVEMKPLFLPFLSESTNKVLYQKGKIVKKAFGVLMGFLRRITHLFLIIKYEYVFIFREASPLGPPVFEWIIAKILRKKIIYDFDDAIWLSNTSKENWIASKLKFHGKVRFICKWAYKISAGNKYLADFANTYNNNVYVIPTVVDVENVHKITYENDKDKIVVGWTGSHSTLKYLRPIVPILAELEKEFSFETLIIADKNPKLPLKNFKFIKWRKETEVHDLSNIDIGIMPLTEDRWSLGKCGFKAIQYMALGIPALVSPIGVNKEIVDNEINGFLCSFESDWKKHLRFLIQHLDIRVKMGQMARKKIVDNYSIQAIKSDFVSLFE